MKKETVIAIGLGILLGIGVALFLVARSKQEEINKTKPITTHSNITPTVAITNVQIQGLEVDQPEDGSIVTKDTVTIKGKASKNSLIVIQTPIKDITLQVDKEQFSSELSLALGENVIRITVYPKDQSLRTQEKELRIYYLDEK